MCAPVGVRACAHLQCRRAGHNRSFLDLKRTHMEEVAARMEQSVEELTKRVEDLMRLH